MVQHSTAWFKVWRGHSIMGSVTKLVHEEGPSHPPQALPVVDRADVVVGERHGVPGRWTATGITTATRLPAFLLPASPSAQPQGGVGGYKPPLSAGGQHSPCGTFQLHKAGKRKARISSSERPPAESPAPGSVQRGVHDMHPTQLQRSLGPRASPAKQGALPPGRPSSGQHRAAQITAVNSSG